MRLRKTITIPTRFEEEDAPPAKSRNGTRPTYPALLKEQIIPFDPNHPPAAFPSLSLKTKDTSDHVQIETESDHSFTNSQHGRKGLRIDILDDLNDPLSNAHESMLSLDTDIRLNETDNLARDDEFDEYDGLTLVDMMQPPLRDPDDTSISEQDKVHSMEDYASTWGALPLSMQSHIYMALNRQYSPKSVSRVLGLTESEFDAIQKAIRLRSLHPASLSEIWEYANQLSNSIGGLPELNSIHFNTLNEHMDYMVFASNYSFAYESEVRGARNFLASRGISSDLLGTWLPDPSEPDGSECLVHVPGVLGRTSLPAIDVHDDSGYSSMSDPMTQAYAFDPESTLVHFPEDLTASAQSAVDAEVRHDSSSKDTSGATIAEQCGITTEGTGNALSVPVEELSEEEAMPVRPNPRHLVLRIQNKDGLARIMQKGPKSAESYDSTTPAEPGLPAYPSARDTQHPAEVAPLRSLNLNTKMSSFSKALIESALHAAEETTPSSKSNYLSFRAVGTPTKPVSMPTLLTKRKPSQTDISPASAKIQRAATHSQHSSPRNGIVTKEGNNIRLSHSQAKQSWTPRPSSSRTSSEISTPTKRNVEVTESVPSNSAEAQPSFRSPRSPSYSPISENEELEEFQALIRGPKAPTLSIKVPTPTMELEPLRTLSLTPTHGLSLHFQERVTLNSPALLGSSQHVIRRPSPSVFSYTTKVVADAETSSSPEDSGDLVTAPMPKIKLIVRRPSSTLDTADADDSKEDKSGPKSTLQTQVPQHVVEEGPTAVSTPTLDQEVATKAKTAKRARPRKETPQPQAKVPAKPPGKKRGPRGPYRKTKERLAREEEERTTQDGRDQNQAEQDAQQQQQEAQAEQASQQEPLNRKKKAPMF
ncbi:hypothetical protein EDD37DRAFT_650864 [Exophiala viscosa]|uniref:Uncharacterized protein n=1 Tax=Exophiala viscosa TaxID=2486360 RepID=A0AAN6DR71_9EURO|nr:hypothetical protein EDD36DRAFT_286869 [Exophiala viscosa]KAI1623772.1 hypothetical protein EDD37DRAFT_650864 [Exophiala viscosa]